MATKFDKRLDQLEEKIAAAGKLPKAARGPHIRWWDIGAEKPNFADIKADLMEQYGTTDGANFVTMGWKRPDEGDVGPDSDETTGDPIEGR